MMRFVCSLLGAVWCAAFASSALAQADAPAARMIVVVGASGEPTYEPLFREWADRLTAAAAKSQTPCTVIGLDAEGGTPDRERLHQALSEWTSSADSAPATASWLILIGHGTFDGKTARYNLRGPDVSPDELKGWLPKSGGPLAIVDCTSSSGPFLAPLSGPNRVVVTATKSGHEYNFARFGDYFSAALADPAADLDKDDQTSLLEAFLLAQNKVREFYESDHRLATEHALIDDNGDALGTPGEWFQGLRPTKQAKAGAALDGALAAKLVLVPSAREADWSAERRQRRDELERRLGDLRQRKSSLPEEEYLGLIEPVLIDLARLTIEDAPPAEPAVAPGEPPAPESPAAESPAAESPAEPSDSPATSTRPVSAGR